MKTTSFAFSTAWGLAFAATVSLIIGTQFLGTPAIAAEQPQPEMTLVPADLHNAQRGILGYNVTIDENARTVDVLGGVDVSGTVEFEIDDSNISISATTVDGTIQISIYGERYGAVEKDGQAIAHWVQTGVDEYRLVGFDELHTMSEWQLVRTVLSDSQFGTRGEFTQIDGGLTIWGIVIAVAAIIIGVGVTLYAHLDSQHTAFVEHCANQDQCCYNNGDDPTVPCCDDFFNNCQGTPSHTSFCMLLAGWCQDGGGFGGACDDYDTWCN